MTHVQPGGHRRIDRVLAEDYLADLDRLSLDQLRVRRAEAEQEEVDLSYVRRLLQGRIDVVRAEQAHRREGGGGSVIDRLADILADDPTPGGGVGRYTTMEPSRVAEHRRRVERLVADVEMDDVQARTDEEIAQALSAYRGEEQAVSELRTAVHEVVSRCDTEIARRSTAGHSGDLLPEEDR